MTNKQILCFIIFFPFWISISWAQKEKVSIATSIPLLSLITQEISGPEYALHSITHSGEDSHHFELTPKSIIQFKSYEILIYNGLGLDNSWVQTLKNNSALKTEFVEASQGIKTILYGPNKDIDPHAWHHPDNLLIYIENITKALQKRFPQHNSLFQTRRQSLVEKISLWKKDKQKVFNNIKAPFLLITFHDEFNYLFHFFNLPHLALFHDHENESISPKTLVKTLTEIKKFKHRVFFKEEGLDEVVYNEWLKKTESNAGGLLWGDMPMTGLRSHSLMEYLEHNSTTILNAVKN